ncbi:MAG: efflux RND transporter periplasmic adaptor subunit [Spirochaetales bacterium]|nr:efflux RND transporter periplasmic adaptor subunit [Spirochaetales bacterium]
MKKRALTAVTGAISLGLLLASCGNMPAPGKKDAAQETVDKRFNVKTVLTARQELSSYINLSGDVEASGKVDVYPSAAGKILSLPAKLGDYVAKDQVLAQVDPSMPGMNYAASPVKAPIAGTVTAVNVDLGQTVSQQVPVVTIGQLRELKITSQVPERFIYQVKKGQRAVITTSAAPDKLFEARVAELSPVVNQTSRTMKITLTMEGNTPIKAGMFVSVKLITSTSADALTIPEGALIVRNEEKFVFLVDGETVTKTVVATGKESSGFIEILSGLNEGDEIVTEGKTLLSDGSKVRIVNNLSFKTIMTAAQEENS